MAVKRVVGLPGETIQIRDGDVYADGQIARKSLAQQRATAMLVHDAGFCPHRGIATPPRWEAEHDGRWVVEDGRFTHSEEPGQASADWLAYVHRRRFPGSLGPLEWTFETPISNLCSWNQALGERGENLDPATDLMLSFRVVRTRGSGELGVRIGDGWEAFEVWVDPGKGRLRVLGGDQPSGGEQQDAVAPPVIQGGLEGVVVEVSTFDSQLLVALDGRTVVALPYQRNGSPERRDSRRLAMGCRGLEIEVAEVRVFRDIYYTRPTGWGPRWGINSPVRLGGDEYFVLGDDSPVSDDSRDWPQGPGLAGELVVGKPLLVHCPARSAQLGGWCFQVPDLSKNPLYSVTMATKKDPPPPAHGANKPAYGRSETHKPADHRSDSPKQGGAQSWFSAASIRELIEAVVIAFALAFFVRTFEAEAFVIPTGSMAPTLMGRHKDVFCPRCGYHYQVTASAEVNPETGALLVDRDGRQSINITAGTCPNCHFPMELGPSNPEGKTYSSYKGDRILVAKFPYQFADPKRWDVAVFMYPGRARMNYIKRLVGTPDETLLIRRGNVFVKPKGAEHFEIARKPPAKIVAMMQPVYDNDFVAADLIRGGWPLRWQPESDAGPAPAADRTEAWRVSDDLKSFHAAGTLPGESWLSYRHFVPTEDDWADDPLGRPGRSRVGLSQAPVDHRFRRLQHRGPLRLGRPTH